ncbi:hypothetical protein CQZ93_23300 [Ochrobactrum vermis]|nr:hypothetical protein CQZ93_23300 [Ochrobactrum vermis]
MVRNAAGSTQTITNSGSLYGAPGAITGLGGLALQAQNGVGGVTNISNSGTIGSRPVLGSSIQPVDAAAIAVYGGATVRFENSGTITGRIGFNSSFVSGNTFTNSGTINGSVSLGAGSTNEFIAETGSSVNLGGGTAAAVASGVGGVGFAATGYVDGGLGGNNILTLQQRGGGLGTIDISKYINFSHLNIQSGYWTISGVSGATDAIIADGAAVNIDNAASLGSGLLTFSGGDISTSTGGVTLTNAIQITREMNVTGSNNLTLNGSVFGTGALNKSGSGTLTLNGVNTFSGGTGLAGGKIVAGSSDAFGPGSINVSGNAELDGSTSLSLGNNINLANGATLALDGSNDTSLSGVIAGVGGLVKNGAATLTLNGSNTYTGGTTINAGTLEIGTGGSLASSSAVSLINPGAALDIRAAGSQTLGALSGVAGTSVLLGSGGLTLGSAGNLTFGGTIGSAGGIIKQGSGTQTLIGTNTYTGGTTINAGTLAIGGGGSLAAGGDVNLVAPGASFDISGAVANQTIGALSGVYGTAVALGAHTLSFGGSANQIFSGAISGTGGIVKQGSGQQIFNGINTYAGLTNVNAGSLIIGGTSGTAASVQGNVQVASGATIGGHGRIGGSLLLASGSHLSPGASMGTLTVGGDLTVGRDSYLDFEFGAPGANFTTFGMSDSVKVEGDLRLDGVVLNVIDGGGMGPGLYNMFSYNGALTLSNGGLSLALGSSAQGNIIQIVSGLKQINLIRMAGLQLDFWNANRLASSTRMGGGSGLWSVTTPNWTDSQGSVTGPMTPQPGFALFGGTPGVVTVDNSDGAVKALGMQFASDGYRLAGDALTLVGSERGMDCDR